MKKYRKIKIGVVLCTVLILFSCSAFADTYMKETEKNGKVVRIEWQDVTGVPVPGPAGWAYATRSYSGTTVTEKYYNTDGSPAMNVGGYYGRSLTYGNRHRLEEAVYLDAEGKKTDSTSGFARMKVAYNSSGGVTAAGYYNAAGNSVIVTSLGYSAVRSEYRGKTMTSTVWLNEQKKPVDTPLGYASVIQNVNKSNKVTGIRFEHADGSAASCPEGWSVCERELDKKGREISTRYYDLSGTMIPLYNGYAYEVRSWSGDQACTVIRYDENGKQVTADGYAMKKMEFDQEERLIRESCLDEIGKPIEDIRGIAVREYTYDGNGRLHQVRFKDADGLPSHSAAGYAGYNETLDTDGFPVSRIFIGTDGNPVNTSEGYSEIRTLYDESHRISGMEYYDVNGLLIRAE